MKKYFFLALCLIGLVVFAGGCIDELVPVNKDTVQPEMSEYEFEAFLSNSYDNDGLLVPTHTFYLSRDGSAKVVSILENESLIDIIPLEDLSTSDDDVLSNVIILGDISNTTNATPEYFTDLSLMEHASDINYTISNDVIRGQKHAYISFDHPVTGFVAYTMTVPLGQDFMYITTPPSVVRFVLPEGYTTGNSLVGKVKPSPDSVYTDSMGRENLVWYNELTSTGFMDLLGSYSPEEEGDIEPVPKLISIKFYTKSAPRNLSIALGILGVIAFAVYSRYRAQRKQLENIRKEIESKVTLPKKKGKD